MVVAWAEQLLRGWQGGLEEKRTVLSRSRLVSSLEVMGQHVGLEFPHQRGQAEL